MIFEFIQNANLFSVLFHAGADGGIFVGLLHPILGIDHLLAMVTVGLVSAQMGGRAIWTVPATFVSVMAVGGILGILGFPLPFVEYGIALSVVALGVALLSTKKLSTSLAMVFVGLFAMFHGHAHGTLCKLTCGRTQEMPGSRIVRSIIFTGCPRLLIDRRLR